MFKNHILIAIRSLQRQFTYSLINIFGLAIGIACSAVILVFLINEWSYDRHHEKADRIYKVGVSFFNMSPFAIGPEALGDFLPQQYEGVEAFTRISRAPSLSIANEKQKFDDLAYYTDTSFFKIFSYKFVRGDARTALKNDNSMVITESMAKKYFGDKDAMGQTLLIGKEKKPFQITGVVKDDTRNSQLKSGVWLSIQGILTHETLWSSANVYNYVLLKNGQQQKDLEAALDRLLEKEIYPKPMGVPPGLSFEDYKRHPNAVNFHVNALKDVHLKSKLKYEISEGGDETNMYTFGAISVFVLLLASVNFINLTTARASRRAKEVGVRKVIGSSRGKLIAQFLTESLMVSGAAMLIAIVLGEMFLYLFEFATGGKLIETLWSTWNLAFLVVFALFVGVFSGIYPAFYLTSFKPISVLKGNWAISGGSFFRNALVVSQFTISICLMMCAAVIISQMNFMGSKDLGFDQQNVLTIDNFSRLANQSEAFEQHFSKMAGVVSVSKHTGEPGNGSISASNGFKSKSMPEPISLNTYLGDDAFLPLMGFTIIEGRNFDRKLASDSSAVILTEEGVKALELKNPIGADLEYGHVIGVVKNFHWESLRNSISPTAFIQGKAGRYFHFSMRLTNSSASRIIAEATAKWKELVPDEPIRYHFVDENFGQMLEKEKLLSKAVGFFTVLAIFISCLGLYGLSAYTTEQRNKEIGIRKVLGATASHIVIMLNTKFARLVAISVFIATPTAMYLMNKWMEGFAYHVDLKWWLFAGAIIGAFAVALATVSFHSIKASLTNPVDTLKYE